MHRTFSVPRLIGCWSLVVALTLLVGIHAVSAQTPVQPAYFAPGPQTKECPVIQLAVGASRACQMTTRADLKRVENPNSKVARVEQIKGKSNEILLVGENPGRTLVTFTDQNDRVEVCEVIVAAAFQEKDTFIALVMQKDDQKNVTLKQVPIGGTEITRNDVVRVVASKADPKVYTFVAVGTGKTRVTFYFDEKKTQSVTYDVEVPLENRVEMLRRLIKEVAPNDPVKVTEMQGSRATINDVGEVAKEATVAVLLTGTVAKAETAELIFRAANAIFPATIVSTEQNRGGVNVNETRLDRLNVVNQIRVRGVHMVQLEVVVAVVNRSKARNISFSFASNGRSSFASSIFGGPFAFANALAPGAGGSSSSLSQTGTANLPFGVLNNNGSFMGFLNLLETEGLTKIITEPRVVTLSGKPAYITSGGQTPVLTSSGVGAPTVDYKPFGTVVKFLPVVLGNGKIHLEVNPEVSNINTAAGINISGVTPTIIPGFDVRSALVTVQLEDGQTLAIGGLIQNRVTASISRVPILGDLPYLGAAFSSKTYLENEEEMIILVTPRLVEGVDCTKIPKYLPGRETRVPNDFEFFLEGIMEAPRGQRNVALHPQYYQGAHMGAENIGQIPCADGNCTNRGAGCANGNCAGSPANYQGTRTTSNSISSMAMPTPTFPDVPAIPTSNSKTTADPDLPSLTPLPSPGLGPVVPTTPSGASLPPARLNDPRPVLPPISGPTGSR